MESAHLEQYRIIINDGNDTSATCNDITANLQRNKCTCVDRSKIHPQHVHHYIYFRAYYINRTSACIPNANDRIFAITLPILFTLFLFIFSYLFFWKKIHSLEVYRVHLTGALLGANLCSHCKSFTSGLLAGVC